MLVANRVGSYIRICGFHILGKQAQRMEGPQHATLLTHLRNNPDQATERRQVEGCDVNSIQRDKSRFRGVKPLEQRHACALAATMG